MQERANQIRATCLGPVHTYPFSFENAFFIRFQKYFSPQDNVFESFSPVHTNTQTPFENDNSLLRQQSYSTMHLYVLV